MQIPEQNWQRIVNYFCVGMSHIQNIHVFNLVKNSFDLIIVYERSTLSIVFRKFMFAKYSIVTSISFFLVICTIVIVTFLFTKASIGNQQDIISYAATDYKKVIKLLSTNHDKIDVLLENAISKIKSAVEAIKNNQNGDTNMPLFFDRLTCLSDAAILANIFEAMSLLHPDQKTRTAALEAKLKITHYAIKHIEHNEDIYRAIKTWYKSLKEKKILNEVQMYCIEEIIENFHRNGIQLPKEDREKLGIALKDMQKYSAQFEQNINTIVSTIDVNKEELDGLPDSFIETLTITKEGKYTLTTDYPVFFTIMENCKNQETRKKLYRIFNNRGYPNNEEILSDLIKSRTNVAHLLGFSTFAEYDIANQMAKNCEFVENFLNNLLNHLSQKLFNEIELLKNEARLAEVSIAKEDKIYPWDTAFLINSYKKRNFNLDELIVSEYFPLEHTVKALLELYESFFGITFETIVSDTPLYHHDVILMQVKQKENDKILGRILFDLYPRENKYSHAAHATLVPAVQIDPSQETEYISIVMANFPRASEGRPSLLKRNDVKTFFHELGHALHALFGKTEFASFSGTNTKWDFVEMPSQMLEEWLYDRTVLKNISKHYITGETLPDDIIDQIIKSKNIFSAFDTRTQIFYALLSLMYYNSNDPVQLFEISKKLRTKLMPELVFDDQNHHYASFGHLGGYGAKYYGYLYSAVFAIDIFSVIKSQGLFDKIVGKNYREMILEKGGSVDPESALMNFLGRKPSIKPFIDNLFNT